MAQLTGAARGQRVWDVANGEAHVRATLDSYLRDHSARLNRDQYARAFAFLWTRFWELSGFEEDWSTPRYVWELKGYIAPKRRAGEFEPLRPMQFPHEDDAHAAVRDLERKGRRLFLCSIALARPRGAYDPAFGQSFSTYSRRILTLRVADWYRTDEEFGDTRYEANRAREESLEALADRRRHDDGAHDDSYLDRHSPGARLEFLDELNTHAYQEPIEEVLTRAAVGF